MLMDLRKLARDKPCMVRVPGICNGDPETTTLAHYRLTGYCGTGLKPPDWMGAWACSSCHAAVDERQSSEFTHDELRQMHLEGVLRTLAEVNALNYEQALPW